MGPAGEEGRPGEIERMVQAETGGVGWGRQGAERSRDERFREATPKRGERERHTERHTERMS